jgi:signal transduction histidine kinase
VPDEETKKVFEDFEQLSKGDARDSSGMGLGLPIARRLARAMGGDVWYERRFPTGARFCYSLPLNRRSVLADADGPQRELKPDELVRVELPETAGSSRG